MKTPHVPDVTDSPAAPLAVGLQRSVGQRDPEAYECKMCGDKTDMPWNWPTPTLCAACARPNVITRKHRKSHAVFGHTHEGLSLTFCGLRWDGRAYPSKGNHCKHCTKELRKAGMSWKWYESQDALAALPNDPKLSHGHRTVTPKCNGDNQISYPGRNSRRGGRWLQRGVRQISPTLTLIITRLQVGCSD